jgi:hypothetical protein
MPIIYNSPYPFFNFYFVYEYKQSIVKYPYILCLPQIYRYKALIIFSLSIYKLEGYWIVELIALYPSYSLEYEPIISNYPFGYILKEIECYIGFVGIGLIELVLLQD